MFKMICDKKEYVEGMYMTIFNFFSLLGGLALFLYGMHMTSKGLEVAAGDKLKEVLKKLTSNRLLGVLVGTVITAIIQSSSATTVMVVGFVNSGLMQLENAIWVIMGANVGTTITSQLIAFQIADYAPLILFIGVALVVFFKSKKLDAYGDIIAGVGMIFVGMEMMSTSMEPLRTMPEFLNLIVHFENPLIGILVGALFTALIQSSAASVGILQALAISGSISLSSAVYVLYGQNIGTCITAALASIGTNRNAKRVTILHLAFNTIGTIVFVLISLTTHFIPFIEHLSLGNEAAQIANVHTIFNLVTTLLLLPFGQYLVKLSFKILPEKNSQEELMTTKFLDFSIFQNDYHVGTRAIAGQQLYDETQFMFNLVKENVNRSFNLLIHYDEDSYSVLVKKSEYINFLNDEIIRFTINALSSTISNDAAVALGNFISIVNDAKKINAHADNMAKIARDCLDMNSYFSKEALIELETLSGLTNELLKQLKTVSHRELGLVMINVEELRNDIEYKVRRYAALQIIRLKEKKCKPYNSSLYTQVLTDIERICDYANSITKSFFELQEEVLNI